MCRRGGYSYAPPPPPTSGIPPPPCRGYRPLRLPRRCLWFYTVSRQIFIVIYNQGHYSITEKNNAQNCLSYNFLYILNQRINLSSTSLSRNAVAQLIIYMGFCEPQHHRTCCIYGISYGEVALEVVSRGNLIITNYIFNNYGLDTLYISIFNLLVKTLRMKIRE